MACVVGGEVLPQAGPAEGFLDHASPRSFQQALGKRRSSRTKGVSETVGSAPSATTSTPVDR